MGEGKKGVLIYNLQVRLFCPRCKKEVEFTDEMTFNPELHHELAELVRIANMTHHQLGDCHE